MSYPERCFIGLLQQATYPIDEMVHGFRCILMSGIFPFFDILRKMQ
jgi:hypothetical protein